MPVQHVLGIAGPDNTDFQVTGGLQPGRPMRFEFRIRAKIGNFGRDGGDVSPEHPGQADRVEVVIKIHTCRSTLDDFVDSGEAFRKIFEAVGCPEQHARPQRLQPRRVSDELNRVA